MARALGRTEGQKRMKLFEPTAPTKDRKGQDIPGQPQEHIIFANRLDRTGREGEAGGVEFGEWNTRFTIRRIGIENIALDWTIEDERGRTYSITGVGDAPDSQETGDSRFYVYARSLG